MARPLYDPTSERALARDAAAGRPDALRELYDRHGADLLRVARGITGSADDADDVLQELFVGLPEALRRFDGRGSLEGWLRTVAARFALRWMRAEGRRTRIPIEPDSGPTTRRDAGTDAGMRVLLGQRIRTAVDELPDALREVFALREIEGFSHAEIARLLDITEGASQVRLHRARAILRQRLRRER